MYKICVVTPVYNGYPLIKDTIQSILSQENEKNYTINYIVSDGGSSDGTVEYIKKISHEFHLKGHRCTLISEPDHGMYDALAKGFILDSNSSDIYCYINAGDLFSRNCFDIVCSEISNNNNWICGLSVKYNKFGRICEVIKPLKFDNNLIREGYYGSLLRFIQQESTFWSGSIHSAIDMCRLKSYKYAGDFYIWKCLSYESNLLVIDEWLGGFRVHDGQLSQIHYKEYMNEFHATRDKRTIGSWAKACLLWVIERLPYGIIRNDCK